jgi:predicted transposase/invertase (TIGR01784 family)
MGNKDIISKKMLRRLAVDIANLLLDLNVDTEAVELLETEHQRIELRQADMVVRLKEAPTGKPFILHLEIQNNNDQKMPLRMLRYYTDIQMSWQKEEVRQYMLYIGSSKLRMDSGIQTPSLNYQYRVLDIHTVDCDLLIQQDNPDALVLAILCDFKQRPAHEVVQYIVARLHHLLEHDSKGFRDYFSMLEILSENRNLQTEIDEAKDMLTQINMEKLPSFQWGMERGIERGIEQGSQNERIKLARQLLDILDNQTIADKTGLSLEEVITLREESA